MAVSSGKPGFNPAMHALLTAAVGAYLLYIAYRVSFGAKGELSPALSIVLGVFFALAGAAVLGYALVLYRAARRKPDAPDEQAKG